MSGMGNLSSIDTIGMDKTSLDTSSGTLFVREGVCLRMSTSRRT